MEGHEIIDPPGAPQFWLIGGPNGAGKTTLARNVLPALDLPATTSILNPDAVTRAFHQVLPRPLRRLISFAAPQGDMLVNWAGVASVEAVVGACIEERTDVCAETVLSTPKFMRHVRRARENGMKSGLIFVALKDPAEHIDRVKARVKAGGHDVPEKKVRSRWEGSHRQLTAFAREVDHLLVYANEKLGEPEIVAERVGGVLSIYLPERLPRVTLALAGIR
jgi:predicted ABC-type ATPase